MSIYKTESTRLQEVAYIKENTQYFDLSEISHIEFRTVGENAIEAIIDELLYSLGVSPTELIVKKFNLKHHKHQNYQFKVI